MNLQKRQARARAKAKANRLRRNQHVPSFRSKPVHAVRARASGALAILASAFARPDDDGGVPL